MRFCYCFYLNANLCSLELYLIEEAKKYPEYKKIFISYNGSFLKPIPKMSINKAASGYKADLHRNSKCQPFPGSLKFQTPAQIKPTTH